jgi:hypothetical protein
MPGMTAPARTSDALNERAIASLEYIRTTIERSSAFTAVPGLGGIAMGVVGLTAAVAGAREPLGWSWLGVWVASAAIAAPVGLAAMRLKAARHQVPLWSASGRRFAQGFAPALIAAAVLTLALARADRFDLLPAVWLLLYGAGILAGSIASIPLLAWVGAAFMLLGGGAAVTGGAWGDVWLGAGFGLLHVVFGGIIARKHGG